MATTRPSLKAVGIFGSAADFPTPLKRQADILGRALAARPVLLVSGAGRGICYEVICAFATQGGLTLGVSPAENVEEHVSRYGFPTECFDFIVYTGFGLKGRNVVTVRSVSAAIFVAGGMGTLNEFTIAYDEGKDIGVLCGSGGVADSVQRLSEQLMESGHVSRREERKLLFSADPLELVSRLLDDTVVS